MHEWRKHTRNLPLLVIRWSLFGLQATCRCLCPLQHALEQALRAFDRELVAKYPAQVRAWDFRALLNDAETQGEMLRWVGVTVRF